MKTLILCLLLAGCSISTRNRWRHAVAVADSALLTCDLGQTVAFSDVGKWDRGVEERNFVLGRTPTVTALISWIALATTSVVLADASKSKLGDAWLAAVGVAEIGAVSLNTRYGGLCGYGGGNYSRTYGGK